MNISVYKQRSKQQNSRKTNFMQQSPYCEYVSSVSSSPHMKAKIHYNVHKNIPLDRVLT